MHTTVLEIHNIRKSFKVRTSFFEKAKRVQAVDGVSLSLYKGEILGLVGESGSGKSTLAKLILRLIDPDSGEIYYEGRDILQISQKTFRPYRREIQIVFQDPYASLNPRMTVGEIVGEGPKIHRMAKGKGLKKRVAELLSMVGLRPESAERYPHEFSGGQRQRIGIARALSVDPKVLIADEPVSALDVSIQAQILNLLLDLREKLDLTMIFISHDLRVVEFMCERVAVMYQGKIVELAERDQIYSNPQHRYTRMLLSNIPSLDPQGGRK